MTEKEIEALADRIYVTLRAAANTYEDQNDDSRKIRARYEELRRNRYLIRVSPHSAYTEWLRGVLAEAFGEGGRPC